MKWLLVGVLAVVCLVVVLGSGAPTIEPQHEQAVARECERWLSEEYGPDRKATAIDTWLKRGQIVVELVLTEPGETSGQVMLCVYEPSTRTLRKPSVFDTTWSR